MDEIFLCNSFSMLHLFTNVSQAIPRLQKMLQGVANTYHMRTLFELLLVASPKTKLNIIFIIRHLINANILLETFNNALQDTKIKYEEPILLLKTMSNPFVDFLYKYALKIRSGLADKERHNIAVSQQLVKTVLQICMKINPKET